MSAYFYVYMYTVFFVNLPTLTLCAMYISESCIKIKVNLNFYFTLLCGEAWQTSVKTKI